VRLAVCLHGAAVGASSLRLSPGDERALELAAKVASDVAVIELLSQSGTSPIAITRALGLGATRAVRIVDAALGVGDARTTGFVLGTALERLGVDVALFSDEAALEGVADVPASVAHHVTATYLTDVIDLRPSTNGAGIIATARHDRWLRDLELSGDAVVGIVGAPENAPRATRGSRGDGPDAANAAGVAAPAIQVLSLADLQIDPTLVLRRSDPRGVIQNVSRPLVTVASAEALTELLRPH